jgi:plastocyanin
MNQSQPQTQSQSQSQSQSQNVVIDNTNVNNNNNSVVVYGQNNQPNQPNPPSTNNLDVVCEVSDTSIEEGDSVTFTANVSGGTSPYVYDWNGDINSSNRSVTARFNNDGSYTASVTVRDNNGRTATDSCATVRVSSNNNNNNDNLDVQCKVSDSSVEDGDYVTISVEIDGGNSPYDINWSGDTGDFRNFDKRDESQRVRVDSNQSRIELEVTVRDDDGNRESDTCTIRLDDNRSSDNRNVNEGELSGLSSVFLSQVPYTGPEDILKTLGFLAGLLIWSAVVGVVLLRKKNKKELSNKAQAFKEANRLQKISN